jgi:hypothetical protein
VSPLISTAAEGGDDVTTGQIVPGAPEDVFWALGFRDQVVAVLPSAGVVAVRLGPAPPPDAPFSQVELTNGLVEALGDGG